MDRLRLIAEIFSRPALWDLQCEEYKSRINIPGTWKEVAASMGPDATVYECKRKWKNLRDAYRAEIKRIELRIERDLMKGTYHPKNDYRSKWAYFEHLKFIKDIKRPRRNKLKEDHNTSSNDNYDDDIDELEQFSELHDIDNIKLEIDDETNSQPPALDKEDDDNNDTRRTDNEILFNETEKQQQAHTEDASHQSPAITNSPEILKDAHDKSLSAHCVCLKRPYVQEDLENEGNNTFKSTRYNTTPSSDFAHVGDPDYNFLISFLPQIKKMNELQNLKFRAKMSDFMFNIMSEAMANNVS